MAVDVFLKLGDVKGESKDSKHEGEIDVLSWSWGVAQTGIGSMGGGKTFSIDDMVRILDDPATKYTTTPEHVMKYAQFMNDIGSLKHRPASIRDLFFDYGASAEGN